MKKLLITALSALSVLLGTASVVAATADPSGAADGSVMAAGASRGTSPGLDGVDGQHNETLVRDEG